MDRIDAIERLEEIKDEILEKIDEALNILREVAPGEAERAYSYWYAHIKSAVTRDHGFLGGSVVTMEDSINVLEEMEEE